MPRTAQVTAFFLGAHQGLPTPHVPPAQPTFRDGNHVYCPNGNLWIRHQGRWIVPTQPEGLALPDQTVTDWCQTRHHPHSDVTLHQHTP